MGQVKQIKNFSEPSSTEGLRLLKAFMLISCPKKRMRVIEIAENIELDAKTDILLKISSNQKLD